MNLAQRIAQEFNTIRSTDLALKLDTATFNTDYFEKTGNDIVFKGNLIPSSTVTWNIGSLTNKLNSLYVAANTIYLGDSTTLSGTSLTVDGGASPTTLAETPTLIASTLIAKPFTYNPGTGNVTVRPTIAFQDTLGNNYPISFDTVNNKFSFDANGNYGTGTIVAQDLELSGTLALAGYTFSPALLTVDNSVILGSDATDSITLRGTTSIEAPLTFSNTATLGDGNDTITVNCGSANNFTIAAANIGLSSTGVLSGVSISESQISDLGSSDKSLQSGTSLSLSINSLTLTKGDGTTDVVDLTQYLDNSTITVTTGTLDAATGIATFTRSDLSTFTVDLSALLDNTNLVTSVNGQAGVINLSLDNIISGTAGDILYHNGTSWTPILAGAEGDVLTMVNGVPTWRSLQIG